MERGQNLCVLWQRWEYWPSFFLLFCCYRLIWNLIRWALDLRSIPVDLTDCFGRWIKSFPKEDKKLTLVGTSALLWAIWKCRNDIIFDRKKMNDPMGLIKLMCNWISDWAVLQIKDPGGRALMLGARLIKQVASEIYRASQGWRIGVQRLEAWSFLWKTPSAAPGGSPFALDLSKIVDGGMSSSVPLHFMPFSKLWRVICWLVICGDRLKT